MALEEVRVTHRYVLTLTYWKTRKFEYGRKGVSHEKRKRETGRGSLRRGLS